MSRYKLNFIIPRRYNINDNIVMMYLNWWKKSMILEFFVFLRQNFFYRIVFWICLITYKEKEKKGTKIYLLLQITIANEAQTMSRGFLNLKTNFKINFWDSHSVSTLFLATQDSALLNLIWDIYMQSNLCTTTTLGTRNLWPLWTGCRCSEVRFYCKHSNWISKKEVAVGRWLLA